MPTSFTQRDSFGTRGLAAVAAFRFAGFATRFAAAFARFAAGFARFAGFAGFARGFAVAFDFDFDFDLGVGFVLAGMQSVPISYARGMTNKKSRGGMNR
nr:hypothetical protein [Kofleriaceae bacterium]